MSRVAGLLRPREGLLAIALLLSAGVAGVACESAGSDDAPEGRIAFTIPLGDGEWRPAIANADGSGDPTVLRHPVEPGWAEWSPDGKKIAYNGDVFSVVNADGTGLRQVAETPFSQGFEWSPDGDQIATLDGSELYVVDADGTDRRRIVRGQYGLENVSWSPDGRTIIYSTLNPAEGPRLYLADSDGTGTRAFARGDGASWSPDGKQIAFDRTLWPPYYMDSTGNEHERPSSVYVIDSDGSGERRLGRGERPAWSPDGGRIAFARDGVVYVIDSDGDGERRIGRGDYFSWAPSGTHMAVRRDSKNPSGPRPETAIWVLNVDGSRERRIWPRRGLCECSSPTWLPD